MKSLSQAIHAILMIVCVSTLISCFTVTADVKDLSELNSDEYILVGRIELDPPLTSREVKLGIGGDVSKIMTAILLTDKLYSIEQYDSSLWSIMDLIYLGKDFYIKKKYTKKIILSPPSVGIGEGGTMYLPGGIEAEVPEGVKIAYFGTIRYHRDVYKQITDIEFVDDWKRISSEIDSRYGNEVRFDKLELKKPDKK